MAAEKAIGKVFRLTAHGPARQRHAETARQEETAAQRRISGC
jgi:hypothetical protein